MPVPAQLSLHLSLSGSCRHQPGTARCSSSSTVVVVVTGRSNVSAALPTREAKRPNQAGENYGPLQLSRPPPFFLPSSLGPPAISCETAIGSACMPRLFFFLILHTFFSASRWGLLLEIRTSYIPTPFLPRSMVMKQYRTSVLSNPRWMFSDRKAAWVWQPWSLLSLFPQHLLPPGHVHLPMARSYV